MTISSTITMTINITRGYSIEATTITIEIVMGRIVDTMSIQVMDTIPTITNIV